jgi:Uncharacterized iron-regulated protein
MYRILQLLTDAEIAECRRIAAASPFVDGRITNPHNTAKQNEQLHEPQAIRKALSCCSRHSRAARSSATSPSRS